MIKVLDKFIADKIAAGEVVERPVSAVKELVENSIDAGAHSIIVEIRGGGKSYIRVTDDGSGIPAEEVETAFLRHATSKISGITDLDNITSLGFRGEALASICAISKLSIVTRTKESSTGVRLTLHGGKVISNQVTGTNVGTTIVVEDIFYNTPARRKFMGSDAREGTAIIELIQQYAICYADIRFMLVRNGETIFTTAGDGNTLSSIQRIYPDKDHAKLIEVNSEHVRGFISDPLTVKNSRKGQLFFVNGRLVNSPIIEKGLMQGYGGRVFSGFPIAILFTEAEPSEIDVNIHPGKREIKFLKADKIINTIADAVGTAMKSIESVPSMKPKEEKKPEYAEVNDKAKASAKPILTGEQSSIRDYLGSLKRPEPVAPAKPTAPVKKPEPIEKPQTISEVGKPAMKPAEPKSDKTLATLPAQERKFTPVTETTASEVLGKPVSKPAAPEIAPAPMPAAEPEVKTPEVPAAPEVVTFDIAAPTAIPFRFEDLQFAGYVFNTYIIMQAAKVMYLFDQHAAHERINYERFVGAYNDSTQLPQPILTPLVLSFSPDVYETGREMLEHLKRMGYDISDFGAGSFVVRGIPAYVTLAEAEGFVREYFEAAAEMSKGAAQNSKNTTVIDKLIMRSCKASVKAGARLSEMEIKQLISQLAECKNPYCCPHGRPTFIRFTEYEIERSFKRK